MYNQSVILRDLLDAIGGLRLKKQIKIICFISYSLAFSIGLYYLSFISNTKKKIIIRLYLEK